jgi:MYXO-CTERM domain-containing protein
MDQRPVLNLLPLHRCVGLAAGVGIITAFSSVASATLTLSDPFITVRATRGAFTGVFTVPLGDADSGDVDGEPGDDLFLWASAGPITIFDGLNPVATLNELFVFCGRNEVLGARRHGIDMNFNVTAGPGSDPTTFELISPLLGFDTINGATGQASGTLGGSDQNADGITITPGLPGIPNSGMAATYNGMHTLGTDFRDYFMGPMVNTPGQSVGEAGNMPGYDPFNPVEIFLPLVGPVSSLSSTFGFTLSAGDSAGGTSSWVIIPAPGAVTLLGLSGLFLGRRRR